MLELLLASLGLTAAARGLGLAVLRRDGASSCLIVASGFGLALAARIPSGLAGSVGLVLTATAATAAACALVVGVLLERERRALHEEDDETDVGRLLSEATSLRLSRRQRVRRGSHRVGRARPAVRPPGSRS